MATTAEYALGDQPFPRGWFMIATEQEVEGHKPLSLRYFGRDMVLYRGRSGRVFLIDAYCPHMGAHLGRNSSSFIIRDDQQIEGDSIRCPYHGWRFGPDGRCNDIPYSRQKIPATACIESWPVVERAGCVWLWYDPEDGQPEYELPEFSDYGEPYWVNWEINRLGQLNCHPVEILDNMADRAHFEPVHGSSGVEQFENDFEGHVVRLKFIAGHRTLAADEKLETLSWYSGPGILQSEMRGDYPSSVLIAHTPVDDGVVKVWHGLSVKVANEVPTEQDIENARRYQNEHCVAFQQDFEIWSNKRPCPHPMSVQGDGNVAKLRLWYSQFFKPRARAADIHARVDGSYSVEMPVPGAELA